jgi:hypothetical protein
MAESAGEQAGEALWITRERFANEDEVGKVLTSAGDRAVRRRLLGRLL